MISPPLNDLNGTSKFDIEQKKHTGSGRPRISIFSIAFEAGRGEAERKMRGKGGRPSLEPEFPAGAGTYRSQAGVSFSNSLTIYRHQSKY
jgi:hypothetical protein